MLWLNLIPPKLGGSLIAASKVNRTTVYNTAGEKLRQCL